MNEIMKYEAILDQIGSIFSELTSIVTAIKNDFENEKRQDPRLTVEIIDYHLEIVSSYEKSFLGYKNRANSSWSIEKYIDYSNQSLHSFFREFENPFLGSQKWYQKITELIVQLSEKSRQLENLAKSNS